MNERLLKDVLAAAQIVMKALKGLPPVEAPQMKP
jgi:hypothetical protein